jgi:hypothetical protein
MLSLTLPGLLRSTVVKKAGVKIGFISYTFYKMNIDKIDDMVQIIIDEALCPNGCPINCSHIFF